MKHLYVIGNGFDCHHRINSSYNSFYKFLLDDYITLNVPPRAFSNVPLQIWSL